MDPIDFSEFFSTREEANAFSDSIDAICESVYTVNFNIENELIKHFGLHKKDFLLKLLREQTFNGLSNTAIKECLLRWQQMISKIPILDITIAFEPYEQTLKVLSDWVSVNLRRQFLFDIKVEKGLIGGATFSFNGKHMDYSIKPILEKILNEKPNEPIKQQINKTPEAAHQSLDHMHIGR